MKLITERFNNSEEELPGTGDWKKTRNYLYRSSGQLTNTQVEQVLTFLGTEFSNDIDLQKSILQSVPRILRKNVKTFLRPTAVFLRELYGDEMFSQYVRRKPDLLLTSGMGYNTDVLELVEVFLREELHLTTASINKLKKSAPLALQLPIHKVLSFVAFFRDLLVENSGYSDDTVNTIIGKIILSQPHILQLSIEKNLTPHIEYIRKRCKLDPSEMATLIKKSTSVGIFALSIEDNMRPTLDYLSSILRNPDKDLRKVVLAHPQLLGLSIINLSTKVAYFDSIDRSSYPEFNGQDSLLRPPSLASRILVRSPAIFSLSLADNICPKVEFLAQVWGKPAPSSYLENNENDITAASIPVSSQRLEAPSSDTLSSLIVEYPNILTLSLEGNIQPTVNFFNRTGYLAAKGNTTKFRSILRGREMAASLFNRLLPRWHYALSRSSCSDRPSPPVPLHILTSATDVLFCQHLEADYHDYQKFKSEQSPRLKLSYQFDTWINTGSRIDV